jgi:hypothetical protein
MVELSGAISDRIRRGEIDADPLAPRTIVDDSPSPDSLKYGGGHGLGEGATRKRSGPGAQTHGEDTP